MPSRSPWGDPEREEEDYIAPPSFQIPRGSTLVDVPFETLVALIQAAGGCVVLDAADVAAVDPRRHKIVTYLRRDPDAYVIKVEEV